jgi:hypothetical protein
MPLVRARAVAQLLAQAALALVGPWAELAQVAAPQAVAQEVPLAVALRAAAQAVPLRAAQVVALPAVARANNFR